MQPSDSQPPQKEEKVSFWAKLFGKKPKTPTVPPRESLTPPPQLGNDTEVSAPPVPGAVPPPVDTGVNQGPSAPDGTPPVNPGAPDVPGWNEQKPL